MTSLQSKTILNAVQQTADTQTADTPRMQQPSESWNCQSGRFTIEAMNISRSLRWFSLLAGVAVSVSGLLLLFPFFGTDILDMQLAQVVHAIVAILFVALILGHIYIGTLGMEGAFEAMGTGEVDLNWAKEHHDLWLKDQLAKERVAGPSTAAPAE